MKFLVLLAALAPLGALAVSPFRIDVGVLKPAAWDVCEARDASECPGRCSVCTNRFTDDQLCFRDAIAAKLPDVIFKCKRGEAEAEVAAATEEDATKPGPKPSPWALCEKLKTKAECEAAKGCSACSIASKKGKKDKLMCFNDALAKMLPPFIFKCSKGEAELLGRRSGPADADAEDGKAKPAPWEVCETYGPGECRDNDDRCSLCKEETSGIELCFRPHVAAKLPPFVFKCSKVKGAEQDEATGIAAVVDEVEAAAVGAVGTVLAELAHLAEGGDDNKKKPKPWTPCEGFNATECKADAACVLCSVEGKKAKKGKKPKEMCFNVDIAQMLPPFIFHCKLPKEGEDALEVVAAAAAEDGKAKPAPWEVCETYGPGECRDNDDRCSLCKEKTSGIELCFRPHVAAKLPPFVFECKGAKEEGAELAAAEEDKAKPSPWSGCEMLKTKAECEAAKGCSACSVAGKKGKKDKLMCFNDDLAKMLPPFIFKCSKGEAEAEAANGSDNPKPAPWSGCEMAKTGAECEAIKGCSLCTDKDGDEMCFSDTIASKLPPFIFKCTKGEAAEAAVAEANPAPAPWVPCEAFKAAECEAHAADCALCSVPGKAGKPDKDMCFGLEFAKMLPPMVFKCNIDPAAEV